MYRTELIYFVIFAIITLFSQFLPTAILLPLDNFIIRIAIVMILLYVIGIGPTAGIMGLVAIASMYIERNRRKVVVAAKKLESMDFSPRPATVEEASKPQTTVPVNEFDKPVEEEFDYLPHETCSDNFEPVAESINEKAVLSTIYPLHGSESGTGSNKLYEQMGFGHIQGLETVGNYN